VDPRIERTRAAVMDACRTLLLTEGPSAITIDAVVATSGVAKSTLYRHWATRDDLLAAFVTSCAPSFAPPREDVPFEASLRATIHDVAAGLRDESWRRLIPAILVLEAQHPELAELNAELYGEQLALAERLLGRGVAEGRLRPEVLDDVEHSIALLFGPVFMGALARRGLTADLVDLAVDQFLAAHRPPAPG